MSTPATLDQVTAFIKGARNEITSIKGAEFATLQISIGVEGPKFTSLFWIKEESILLSAPTIGELAAAIRSRLNPTSLATELRSRADALRNQADELERGAA